MLHMKLGFEPQFDWSKVTYTNNLKNVNFIQKHRLKRLLIREKECYMRDFSAKFIK